MWCFDPKKSLNERRKLGRRIVVMKLICSLRHCEYNGPTVHKLSQRRLTADWLAPRESGCSRMHSKVSFDWPPSRPRDRFSRYSKWQDIFQRVLVQECQSVYVWCRTEVSLPYWETNPVVWTVAYWSSNTKPKCETYRQIKKRQQQSMRNIPVV
jgi:hypothetical protein